MDKEKLKSPLMRRHLLIGAFAFFVFLLSNLCFTNKAHAQLYGRDTAFVTQNGNIELWEQVFETHMSFPGGGDVLIARDTYFYSTDLDNVPVTGYGFYIREAGGKQYDTGDELNSDMQDFMDVKAMEMAVMDALDWVAVFKELGLDPNDFGLE